MIGLFGGTFDPIHNGHLHGALKAAEALGCQVRMVLSARPPHRPPPTASVQHRWAMLEAACAAHADLLPDASEAHRPRESYTVDTLAAMRSQRPDEPLGWIIGTDAFNEIRSWHNWRQVLDLAHLLLLPRPGAAMTGAARKIYQRHRQIDLFEAPAGGIRLLEGAMLPVSASEIRERLAAGADASDLLPECVSAYIRRHGLYARRPLEA